MMRFLNLKLRSLSSYYLHALTTCNVIPNWSITSRKINTTCHLPANVESRATLVYKSPHRKLVLGAKTFSLLSSSIVILLQPFLFSHISDVKIFSVALFGGLVFSLSTPALLHILTRSHVTELYYSQDSKVFTAYLKGILLNTKKLEFTAEDVKYAESMFTMASITAKVPLQHISYAFTCKQVVRPPVLALQLVSQLFTRFEHGSPCYLPNLKKRAPGHTVRPFISSKRVVVKAGDGGNGCIAFRRIFCNPHAGPSGGDGGNGAHVIFRADESTSDLSNVPTVIKGQNGASGSMNDCHGENADHVYVKVPLGTQIFSACENLDSVSKDNRSSVLMKTLQSPGDIFLAARGGAGGKGNAFMTYATLAVDSMKLPSSKNTPLRIAERGGQGETKEFILRMRKLADLGFVGCPNAGKSTLLKCLTRARPKIAPYPFTTLQPHIGMLNVPENYQLYSSSDSTDNDYSPDSSNEIHSIAIADLPGIIDGAADYNRVDFNLKCNNLENNAYILETLSHTLHKVACSLGVISDTPESRDRVMLVSAKRGDNIPQLVCKLLKYVQKSDKKL
ncbi:unnamed protein product [Heterobilharzia americana]|nr:unnamed protein product [Heterobilharzia americana]